MIDNWKPDERTVRACIDALPVPISIPRMGFIETAAGIASRARDALEAILPKPADPVKELVKEWYEETLGMAGGTAIENNEHFARWLLTIKGYQAP